jgi:hypothetical protein
MKGSVVPGEELQVDKDQGVSPKPQNPGKWINVKVFKQSK